VLASDTKVRTTGDEGIFVTAPSSLASYVKHESKVLISSRHQIAIATAGYTASNTDAARDLDLKLQQMESLPADFAGYLESWARSYAEHEPETDPSLLIVNPAVDKPSILTMRVTKAKATPDLRSFLHPNPN